jgi:hypothetical protein
VAFLTAALGRYTASAQCLLALDRPKGTHVEWFSGGVHIAKNRNIIVKQFMDHFSGDWLVFIDDDQVFASDLLMRLLVHLRDERVDIVVPLILRKGPSNLPALACESADGLEQLVLTTQRGLLPVDAAGTGVMLIRRRVFERVKGPVWFETHGSPMDAPYGQIGEDYYFCLKARRAGCGVFCDFDTFVGHIMPMAIWPTRLSDGRLGSVMTNLNLGSLAAAVGTIEMGAQEAAHLGSVTTAHRSTLLKPTSSKAPQRSGPIKRAAEGDHRQSARRRRGPR